MWIGFIIFYSAVFIYCIYRSGIYDATQKFMPEFLLYRAAPIQIERVDRPVKQIRSTFTTSYMEQQMAPKDALEMHINRTLLQRFLPELEKVVRKEKIENNDGSLTYMYDLLVV